MKKTFLFVLISGSILCVAVLRYICGRRILLANNSTQTIEVDSSFQGKKLGDNYYEFSLIDYHKLLFRDQPFLIYFYATWCAECEKQQQIIQDLANAHKLNKIILRANFSDDYTDETEKTISKSWQIKQPNVFVVLDKDSNPLIIEEAKANTLQLHRMLERI